jgi:CheY-like chemotaxis protein
MADKTMSRNTPFVSCRTESRFSTEHPSRRLVIGIENATRRVFFDVAVRRHSSFSKSCGTNKVTTESLTPMNDNKPLPKANVLVVDNDPLVMLGTVMMLRELGYRVTSTELPEQALKQFDGDNAPDILVTDYAMPKMSGFRLAKAAARLKPNTSVLLVTGHSEIQEIVPSEWQFLSKPFSSSELQNALERMEMR